MLKRLCWSAFVTFCCACCAGCDKDVCAAPTAAALDALPERLSETGAFDDDVLAYAPAFPLWSDGAQKARSISLPAGAQIDSRDMDDWRFPAGTRLWKEFTRDGVRVETRLLQKLGDGDEDWAAAAYVWDGDDAVLAIDGADDVAGTAHNVPPAAKCQACHGGRASFVLGFSAVQLGNVDAGAGLTLDDLIAGGLLSDPPERADALRLPGTARERAALGYLHANCSSCHNQERPDRDGPRCYDPRRDFDLFLRAGDLGDLDDTAAYRTVVDDGALVAHGDAARSALLGRMQQRAKNSLVNEQMPPLASEDVDEDGVDAVAAWINDL